MSILVSLITIPTENKMSDEFLNKIIDIASDLFKVPQNSINSDTSIGDVDNWDSLGHLNFMLSIENELKVKFTANEIISLKSVGEIVERLKDT